METREIPTYKLHALTCKQHEYCICIPIINEGDRFRKQLMHMHAIGIPDIADILIFDGGSTDNSTNIDFLRDNRVTALLIKTGSGKLGAQLRMGYSYALDQGYRGLITIDGNNKDNTETIPSFIDHLQRGFDFVQGSRFISGGKAINTPIQRLLAIKIIHAPIISMLAGYHYTDTTNGYRGYSRRLLLDSRISIFRSIFDTYQLIFYLSVKAPRLGYKTTETPVIRSYPAHGKTPTKIKRGGNLKIIWTLVKLLFKKYDIKTDTNTSPK